MMLTTRLQSPTTIWQIGDFDGTPRGFLNAKYVQQFSFPPFWIYLAFQLDRDDAVCILVSIIIE